MISHSLAETKKLAEEFSKDLIIKGRGNKSTLIGLYGDLGSGKTAFVQAAAKIFGVNEIVSPTFIIEKIYKTKSDIFETLIHVDAYRLESGKDLIRLGFDEVLKNPKSLIFLEWPERVAEILPDHIRVMCEFVSEKERKYEIIF